MNKIIIILIGVSLVIIIYYLFFPAPDIRNTHPSGRNIICFGDSLTYGTGAAKGMDYPSQLSAMISKPVINAGVPGDTTARALQRLERDVLSRSPRIVLITLGGNDLKNGIKKNVAFDNLKIIVQSIQERGALVIIGGIDIPFWGKGFGDAYKDLCKELGAVLVPNIFEGIMGKAHLMSDQIHPNDAGYTKMAGMFHDAIEPYLVNAHFFSL
ncbi:MAG: arylesterase [bacterium]